MFKRIVSGVKGFTLIELLAVMAIVAVLAGIISVAVSGTGETSRDTQTVQDGTSIESSAADFFGGSTGAEFLEAKGDNVLDIVITTAATGEETSSQWPEEFLTDTYSAEFPVDTSVIKTVTLLDEDGVVETVNPIKTLVHNFTAINFTDLQDGDFLTTTPDSVDAVSTATTGGASFDFHNFLWLFEKDTASGSTGVVNSRNVAIYKLLTIEIVDSGQRFALTFRRIF